MNRTLRTSLLALCGALLVITAACKKQPQQESCPAPDSVVATVGSEKITWAELEEEISAKVSEERRRALEKMVDDRLIEAAAKKNGMTEEQFVRTEVEEKVQPPADAEIQGMFEQLKAQQQLPPDASLDQFKDRIADYMARPKKQARMREVMDELRRENKVALKLPQRRKQVEAKGPARGPEKAPITIVEFSDFECPYCGRAAETVHQVMEQYAGKVRLVFRNFPLDFHPNAQKAAEAALCANEQGKFWELHDVLFKNQKALGVEQLKTYATQVGLDAGKFNACLDAGKHAQTVKQDMEAGKKAGVSGTPAFFINGIFLNGAQPIEEFKRIIDQELAGA